MRNDLIDCLKAGFEVGVGWTNEEGKLLDAYESNRPENFAPGCWSVVGATLYRLTGEDRYLEWTERWVERTAAILEEAKGSPGFREYVMGYGAMVFPVLSGVVEAEKLADWKQAFANSYVEDAEFSDCHVSAASLVCDLYGDLDREEKAKKRAEAIVALFKVRMTPGGFLKDDDVNGNSIPHAYLTGSFMAAALLNSTPDTVDEEIADLFQAMCAWFKRANGAFDLPVLASRSIYQMYVYPAAALLAYIGEGRQAEDRVRALLAFCRSFNVEAGIFSHTPNHFSPYALAGLEWTYNRLNTDLGAGLVAWSLLALLAEQGWEGFETVRSAQVQNVIDPDGGYVVLHGTQARLGFTLCEHDFGYHLPLQPVSLRLSNEMIEPIADAKRDGVKHPFRELIQDKSRMDPLLEPYFGVGVKGADGSYRVMSGRAEVVDEGEYRLLEGDLDLRFKPVVGDGWVRLTYEVGDVGSQDEVFFSVPVLLWDGKDELGYSILEGMLRLRWKDASYRIWTEENEGAWDLDMGRYLHAGYGLTANMRIRLKPSSACTIAIEKLF